MNEITEQNKLIEQLGRLIEDSRKNIVFQINSTMVQTYYSIGKYLVEYEQQGKDRAEYGKSVLQNVSAKLTEKFGKGFSVDNLQNMRLFYTVYSKYETVSRKFNLSWSHYLFLVHIDNEEERKFYEIEASAENWSLRELKRQFNSSLYERLALSRNNEKVKELSKQGLIIENPDDIIKDPYVLEFLGLPEQNTYSESELEQRIIDKLEKFLLELGKGYTFVGRQVRITFSEKHFFVDLVFYNRLLQCFVLIDLKIGEITHQDLGQM